MGRWRLATPGGPSVFFIIGLCATSLSPSWAEEERPAPATAATHRQYQQDAARARQLLVDLQFTPNQARNLLLVLERAATLHIQRYEELTALLPEMREAYTAFAAEDRLNQGFSREVERRTARVHHAEIESGERFDRALLALEQEALRVLTVAQREKLRQLESRARPRRAARRDAAANERLTALHAELEELQARKHPTCGKFGRHVLCPAAYDAVCSLAGVQPSATLRQAVDVELNGTAQFPRDEFEKQLEQVRDLRREINNWNLINGLYLTQPQIERIVALYDAHAAGVRPTAAVAGDASSAVALERAVEEVLNRGQREVLADYKACLIPPKNLKDPVRVGQAKDNSPYEHWLERARQQAGPDLERAIRELLDRESKHHGELTKWERQERANVLRRTARQAARMSDSEFELDKAELAAKITPPDRLDQVRKELETVARAQGRPGRITQFMLNPWFIAQLRERGEQLAAGLTPQPADLTKGPQAENCDRGCALPGKGAARKR